MPGEGIARFRRDRFRAARLAAGLTQKQLAAELRIAQSQISDWERGDVNPRARALHAAAERLGLPVGELVDTDDPPTLRQLRQLAGLSQREIAAQLGVTQQAYNRVERGTVALRPHAAATLAALLGATPDQVHAAWRRSR